MMKRHQEAERKKEPVAIPMVVVIEGKMDQIDAAIKLIYDLYNVPANHFCTLEIARLSD